jgi:hypothetical protein
MLGLRRRTGRRLLGLFRIQTRGFFDATLWQDSDRLVGSAFDGGRLGARLPTVPQPLLLALLHRVSTHMGSLRYFVHADGGVG